MVLLKNNIKERLEKLNMTQKKLSELTGVRSEIITMIIHRRSTPQYKTQKKLADFFQVEIEELFYK